MNVSSSSASAANSVWNLLASRMSQASRSSTAGASERRYDNTSATAGSPETSRPSGPPPPPSSFEMSLSTSQFAGMTGGQGMAPMGPPPGAGGDPMASLDTDADGSVSSAEFGLDEAGDDVKALFNAIDSDGSGDLSTDEMSSFRETMTAAMDAAGGPPPGGPMGPPPGAMSPSDGTDAAADDSDDDAASAQASTSAATTATQPDLRAFLQQLASRYASLSEQGAFAGSSSSSSVSETA